MRPRPETLGRPARPPAAGLLALARRLATGTGPLLVGLLLLLAWGLRLDLLDARNLSGEEARLLWFARTLPPDLGSALGRDLQSPLFAWGLSGWLSLAGSDLLAARLPAALAGLVGVAALVRLGWWAGGPALGLLAGDKRGLAGGTEPPDRGVDGVQLAGHSLPPAAARAVTRSGTAVTRRRFPLRGSSPPPDSNREPLHYKCSALPIELGGRCGVSSA